MHFLNKLMAAACVTLGVATWSATASALPAGTGPAVNGKVLSQLDPDHNGLYDDTERKAFLETLQKQSPEVQGNFDADGDGKVTILEQSQGRHPLSMIVPRSITASAEKIPWAIDMFPEWISTAYFQEDVPPGAVASHLGRGVYKADAKPVAESRLPKKSAAGGGIEFAASSGQQLSMPGQRQARWNYRWTLFTFRIDKGTGTDAETQLLDVNHGNGSGLSSPKVWYHMDTGLHVQFVGTNKGGLDKREMVADNVVADGKTWNVLVCGIRYGQMFACVNGVDLKTETPQQPRFSSNELNGELTSFIGDPGQGNMAWAYDALVFGLTEPSEAMVRKLTGWAAHRLGFQANLPKDDPYRNTRPVLDAEDLPERYVHDDDKWAAWGAKAADKTITRANAGGPRLEPQGFERVFYDDFRNNRLGASNSGEGDLWVGPGFNTAVGVDAPLIAPGQTPDAYPRDAENKKQMLSLVPQNSERWRGSALYTVNDLGYGYTWKGPKIFRIRCMFPKTPPKEVAGGLFPAFWSYDPDYLFWRTANRIEVDYFEFDGLNGAWLNGLSTHLHNSQAPNNIFAKNPAGYKRYKVYGGEMTEAKSKIPGGLFVWDGQYHTWEVVMDKDMTYFNVTVPDGNGKDQWVEICRTPTAPTYLQRLDLQLDYALKARAGKPTKREDFVVDSVEVLQKTDELKAVPAPFTARPRLAGSVTAGSVITCAPNVKGVTDLRYYWFADGYPLTWGPGNTYKVTSAETGKAIRCMVKAVGALDVPEAWSDPLK